MPGPPGINAASTASSTSPSTISAADASSSKAAAEHVEFTYVRNKGYFTQLKWPDWHGSPGVSQWKVLGLVTLVCAVSAVPVWVMPWWRGGLTPAEQQKRAKSAEVKQAARDARLRYMQSDDMPAK